MMRIISIYDFFLAYWSLVTILLRVRYSKVLRLRAGGVPSKTKTGRMLFLLSSMILLRMDLILSVLVVRPESILTIQMEASMATIFPLSLSIW